MMSEDALSNRKMKNKSRHKTDRDDVYYSTDELLTDRDVKPKPAGSSTVFAERDSVGNYNGKTWSVRKCTKHGCLQIYHVGKGSYWCPLCLEQQGDK